MYSLTDRGEAKALYIDLSQRNPHTLSGIVGSLDHVTVGMAQIKHIQRMDVHPRVTVDVGYRKEILHLSDIKPCLFPDLSDDALFTTLSIIHETARQVKGVFGGLLATTGYEQLAFAIQDEGRRCRTGILIICKPTTRAVLALEIMLFEVFAAALRTILEDV